MTAVTDSERLFKSGIAAYQKGDYDRAIALLTQLSHTDSKAYKVKASMGLVRVYMAQNDWAKAASLCQKIAKSTTPSVQQWAQATLTKIETRKAPHSPSVHSPTSGFEPLTSSEASGSEASSAPSPTTSTPSSNSAPRKRASLSGFQPLSQANSLSQAKPPQMSGTALSHKANAKVHRESTATASSDVFSSTVPEVTVPEATVPKSTVTHAASGSIFDYTYLNNEEASRPSPALPESEALLQQASESSSEVDTAADTATAAECEWVYAGRLKKGRKLGNMKRSQLYLAQGLGAIALYILFRYLLLHAIILINRPLAFLDNLLPFWVRQVPIYYKTLTWSVLFLLVGIAIASPWLEDLWLRFTASRQPFSNQKLRAHSPEAATLLGTQCHKKRWPFPTLWKLPTAVPLIFSYGCLPRNARLVVSEGLLEQLEADEIAALVAYELSHWKSGYWPLLSMQTLVLQVFHQLYWQLSLWGNAQTGALQYLAGLVASVSYGVFWILRIPGVWVSKVRTYYGDRAAAELTGNPNGLARALAKLSVGCAMSIEQQGYTPPVLEATSLLLPVAPDLARQKLYGHVPPAQVFAWDSLNPLRAWMSIRDTHPPLGDRIKLLMAYAQHWKLDPEVLLPAPPRRKKKLSQQQWLTLLRQATPFMGLALGFGLWALLWTAGAIAHQLEFSPLDWMYNDLGLFQCCCLLGLAVGTMLRINRFFPDLSWQMPLSETVWQWLISPDLLPVNSLATKLSGQLIGRPGLANWLGQDLLLKTPTGVCKLHAFSAIGPFGNFVRLGKKPADMIGTPVQVLGWFRRGTHPWIDIESVHKDSVHKNVNKQPLLRSAHPIFSLLVALVATGWGLWLLVQGNG